VAGALLGNAVSAGTKLLIAGAMVAWAGAAQVSAAATLTIACAAVGIEQRLCRDGAGAWAARTGHRVTLIQTPSLANERLALFQQLLAAGSSDIDVLQIDVIWPGTLGRYFTDLSPHIDAEVRARHFAALIDNYTVDGALTAMPWYGDVGLLYYRKDLLTRYGHGVPETWDDLAATAAAVVAAERAEDAEGAARMVGYVFQGKAYEGLTCNALEWIVSHGGAILAADGSPAIDRAPAVRAIETAASWIGAIAPKGVLNYAEEEARGTFQSGQAVFMRNWPYAWALVNGAGSPVAGKVGIAPLPRGEGGERVGTLGGGGLAVSKFSAHPALAADLVADLTGYDEQIRRAIAGAFNPTLPAAYDDPDLLRAQPIMAALRPVLTGAVARPARIAGDRYNALSALLWNAVHDSLAGRGDAAGNLEAAALRIKRLRRGGQW